MRATVFNADCVVCGVRCFWLPANRCCSGQCEDVLRTRRELERARRTVDALCCVLFFGGLVMLVLGLAVLLDLAGLSLNHW
jgi:predicted nucleic acid-binding Zn ribbon protein